MTETPTETTETVEAPTVINQATQPAVRERIRTAITEMNLVHKERTEIIEGMWTAAIAHQHFLMIGPGGTGKSFIVRDLVERIEGAKYYEKALDETSVPDEISGPPNLKLLTEEGTFQRNTVGMLPEADYAFLDEFFNANGPALHHTMPMLNERIFHDNGVGMPIPLRTVFMGTNKLNADVDMAALWDRVHHRHKIDYVSDRDNLRALVSEAVLRRAGVATEQSVVTLTEIDAAHKEALVIPVPDATYSVFLDLLANLEHEGVVVSTRRVVEGMVGVLASAWLNDHADGVKVGDLSVLRHMLWSRQEDITKVRTIVLEATNPGEKKALDLLEDLDKLKSDYQSVADLDEVKRNAASIDIFKKVDRILSEGVPLQKQATEVGASTARIDDLIDSCDNLKVKIGSECFGLDEAQIAQMRTQR